MIGDEKGPGEAELFPFGPLMFDSSVNLGNGTSANVTIQPFVFMGRSHSTLFVNTNGLLSFSASVETGNDNDFPNSANVPPFVSPWWNRINTEDGRLGGGSLGTKNNRVYYQEYDLSTEGGRAILSLADSLVRSRSGSIFDNYNATWCFVATWYGVWKKRYTDITLPFSKVTWQDVNTFQVVLMRDASNRSLALLNYPSSGLKWLQTTPTCTYYLNNCPNFYGCQTLGSSTPYSNVGFSAGDGATYYSRPESRTANLSNLAGHGFATGFLYSVKNSVMDISDSGQIYCGKLTSPQALGVRKCGT